MTGSKRRDRAVWWVSGFALGAALLMFLLGVTVVRPLTFAAVPAVLCVVTYGVLGPWLRTTLGRILFSLLLVNAVLLMLTLVNMYWDYPGQFDISRAAFLLAGVVFWTMLAYLATSMSSGRGWHITPYQNAWRARRKTDDAGVK